MHACRFKPGVEALFMIFSDQSTDNVYRFPYYNYFKDAIIPVVEQVRCAGGPRRRRRSLHVHVHVCMQSAAQQGWNRTCACAQAGRASQDPLSAAAAGGSGCVRLLTLVYRPPFAAASAPM